MMLTRFMVIMNEVEKPVNQESFQFFVKTQIVFGCLSMSSMEIDDDITQYEFRMRNSECGMSRFGFDSI